MSPTKTRSWCVPFNFKPSWFTWTLLMAYCKGKLKNNGDRESPCFKPFLIGNVSDKFLCTCESDTFLLALPVLWEYHLNQNNIEDFPPNWIINFLEVDKQLMHCFIVFPFFFLKYLTNAEYMISGCPVALKSILMIPNNFLCIWI